MKTLVNLYLALLLSACGSKHTVTGSIVIKPEPSIQKLELGLSPELLQLVEKSCEAQVVENQAECYYNLLHALSNFKNSGNIKTEK